MPLHIESQDTKGHSQVGKTVMKGNRISLFGGGHIFEVKVTYVRDDVMWSSAIEKVHLAVFVHDHQGLSGVVVAYAANAGGMQAGREIQDG